MVTEQWVVEEVLKVVPDATAAQVLDEGYEFAEQGKVVPTEDV